MSAKSLCGALAVARIPISQHRPVERCLRGMSQRLHGQTLPGFRQTSSRVKERFQADGVDRPREKVSLGAIAAVRAQKCIAAGFHTFRDDFEIQTVPHCHDRFDDRFVALLRADACDERTVDFDQIDVETPQVIQRRMTRSEISTAMRAPSAFDCCTVSIACDTSESAMLSVISISKADAGRPCISKISLRRSQRFD